MQPYRVDASRMIATMATRPRPRQPEGHRMTPTINADRLWQSIMDLSDIGPIPGNGNCRLALTLEDTAARALFLRWCQPLGLTHEQDAIGNQFLRRAGTDKAA